MLETIGQKLQAARTERKLSLDDASRATKIRGRQLADLERDEYSNFPNLAYAKGFLISYGKYLDVDVRPYLDAFEDANSFGLDDYQYLSEVPLGVYRATRRPTRRRGGRKRYAVLAWAAVVLVFATVSWQVYVNYRRLGDLDKLAERQEAGERAADEAAVVKPTPSPQLDASSSPETGPSDATILAFLPRTDLFPGGVRPPALPEPGDGGALRQLTAGASAPRPPFLLYADAAPQFSAAGQRGPESGSWSPENLEGYRFYVRSLDRDSVEIFRTGIRRPETVLNKPL